MKNKVILLDRDGTINVDYGYVYKKEDLTFIDGAIEGLKKLYDNGFKLIIITNQSGIGRGYYSEKEFLEFNKYMLDILKNNGIIIEDVYYCKHSPNENCDCRKPKLKLFYDAIRDYNIDENNSFAIGDKERDIEISRVTNIQGILLDNNKFHNLLDVANYILGGK